MDPNKCWQKDIYGVCISVNIIWLPKDNIVPQSDWFHTHMISDDIPQSDRIWNQSVTLSSV